MSKILLQIGSRTPLLLIVCIGLILRTYLIAELPSGFFADEASIGYNAYTILTKGTDEYGSFSPFFFRAFGEYKNPVQIYSTVPFIALFGLNEFSVRIVSALYGVLGIIALFFLVKEIFHKEKRSYYIAISASFLLTINPWHIHLSRVALEGFMAFIFFTILGLYFFLKSQRNKKYFFLSVVTFILAFYSYFPARLFIPLLGISIFIFYIRFFMRNLRVAILCVLFLSIFLIPFVSSLFSSSALARWQQVSIFSQPPSDVSVTQHIIRNYLSHFSLDFLFTRSDIDMPGQFITRHSVRGIGQLYFFHLPFIILGMLYLFKKNKKIFLIFITWVVIFPSGSMFTTSQSAQATRSVIGIVPFQIFSAVGIFYFLRYLSKLHLYYFQIALGIIFFVILASFMQFVNLYFSKYNLYASDFWGWQYGARDIVKYFASQESKYDELVMAPEFNAPEIFFKFYAPNQCEKCQIGTPKESYNPTKRQLFAVTPAFLNDNPSFIFIAQKIIYYPNKNIAFQIGEVVQ